MAELATLARPYAKAIFELMGDSPKKGEAWSNLLESLTQIARDRDALEFLDSPQLTPEDTFRFLEGFLHKNLRLKLGKQEKNFLKIIVNEKRISLLPYIKEDFRRQLLVSQGKIEAKVESAFALTEAEELQFIEALKKRFKKEIELTVSVNPTLLGGAIIKVDDLVIDGSVQGRLSSMMKSVI